MSILVVDDNTDLANTLAEVLRGEFPAHDLVVGRNGEHALQLTQVRRPHVVVMDFKMPVMGGLESAREMRRRMPHPPPLTLIAMTGNLIAADNDVTRKTFDHILPKPVDIDRLLGLVRAA